MEEQRLAKLLIEVGKQTPDGADRFPKARPDATENDGTRSNPENSKEYNVTRSIERVATVLAQDLAQLEGVFPRIVMQCVRELPIKLPYYGAIIGVLHSRPQTRSLAVRTVEVACFELDSALSSSDFRHMKQILRFLGELVNNKVVLAVSLADTMIGLLNAATDNGYRQELIDAVAYIVMATLPWVAACLSTSATERFETLIQMLQSHMDKRETLFSDPEFSMNSVFDALKVYRDCPADMPYQQVDRLELLWSQLRSFEAAGWESGLLIRPSFEFQEVSPVTIAKLEIPATFRNSPIPDQEPVFWIFDDSVNTPSLHLVDLPSTSSIERFILDDLTVDIIHNLSHNHVVCSELLLALPKDLNTTGWGNGVNSASVYQAIVENLIRELIKLPASQELSVYYATLLSDLCRGAPDKVPSALGRAVRVIFSRMDVGGFSGGMDVECVRRFAEWFAHHLSNFNFTWKWGDWGGVLNNPESAKFCFMRETLEREIRLSYYDRVKGTLPTAFVENGMIFPTVAPGIDFAYGETFRPTDSAFSDLVARVHRSLIQKLDAESISRVLSDLHDHHTEAFNSQEAVSMETEEAPRSEAELAFKSTHPDEVWHGNPIVRDVFIEHVLMIGSKSFSHLLNLLERNVKILHQLNLRPQDRLHTVRIVTKAYASSSQWKEIILDKLVNYRIVDPAAIIRWALDDSVLDAEAASGQSCVWTVLRNALGKVNRKVDGLRKKLEDTSGDIDMDGSSDTRRSYDAAMSEQRETFIAVFKRFSERLSKMRSDGVAESVEWRWIAGHMRNIGRIFRHELKSMIVTVESNVFQQDSAIDPTAAKIWREIKAVAELSV
ncbi:armadillo-type protein [Zopfochytrium polystomum]|nr:armadillo-type protein [Zopfochytrium polystomum]